MAKSDIGSTALSIAAGAVGIYVLLKFLPNYLSSISSGLRGGSSSSGNLGAYASQFPGQQVPINSNTFPSLYQGAEADNNLSLAQSFAGIRNIDNGLNFNGSPLSAAQQSELTPVYTDPVAGDYYTAQPTLTLPGSDFLSLDPTAQSPDAIYAVTTGNDPFGLEDTSDQGVAEAGMDDPFEAFSF